MHLVKAGGQEISNSFQSNPLSNYQDFDLEKMGDFSRIIEERKKYVTAFKASLFQITTTLIWKKWEIYPDRGGGVTISKLKTFTIFNR